MNTDTERQKRAAHLWVNEKLTKKAPSKGRVLSEAGYSESVSKRPGMVMESKGFKKEEENILNKAGLTEEYLANCLKQDIEAKPANRLGEVTLAMKAKGMLKEKVEMNMEVKETADLLKNIIDG